MAIVFSIDNDRVAAGTQNLTTDQTAGTQTPPDGNDVNITLSAASNIDGFGATANSVDAGFETYLAGLGLSPTQKAFAVNVDGAQSSNTFIQATANGGETFTDLRFIDPGATNLITGMQTLAGDPLYLHVDASGNFATVTTAQGAGGTVVAGFALINESINNVTHVATAGVQMVTFQAIKHTDTNSNDETLSFTDVLSVGASATLSFNFAQLDAGNFLWAAVGSSTSAMLITGQDLNVTDTAGGKQGDIDKGGTDPSDAVNTSKASDTTIGINAQHFADSGGGNPTDGSVGVFTFVTGLQPLSGQNPTYTGQNVKQIDYNNYINTSASAVNISQLTGSGTGDMKIALWEAGGGTPASGQDPDQAAGSLLPEEGYADVAGQSYSYIGDQDTDRHLTDDTIVNVGTVTIGANTWNWNDANITTGVTKGTVTVAISGNLITIHGAQAGDTINFTARDDPASALDGTFNRITIQALAHSASFDIGHIDLTQATSSGAGLGSHLFADDDGPGITGTLTGATALTVDETTLATDASASFAGQFTPSYGTDGQAATPVTYALSTPGGASGLVDTASGQNVVLSLNASGQIEGRTATSNALVFVVSVNASGTVSLDQQRAVVHPTNDPDESKSLSAANLVVLTATAHDGDGDIASSPLNIGQLLNFKDDGPGISGTLTNAPTLTVDETVLATNASASFAAQFTPSFGADGQGATPVAYALSTPGGASGLLDTATGQSVVLSVNASGQVEGRTSGSGALVFVVSVSSNGTVTLDQQRAVVHPTNDPDESKSLQAANLVVLTATANDKDGDSASTPLNIGQLLVFKDDGPGISGTLNNAPTLTVDETTLATDASASFAGQFTPTYGADGQGATPVGYALSTPGGASGLVDTASGESVVLSLNASGQVEGRTASGNVLVFVVSVDGSGNVSLDQKRAVVHPTSDPDESKTLSASNLVVLTATANDKDGDSASTPLNIGQLLVFKDDGPSITAVTNTGASVRHDETAGVQADTDVAGSAFITGNSGPTVASLFTGVGATEIGFARSTNSLVTVTGGSAGADGPATQELSYALSVVNGTPSGVSTTGGTAIFMYNGTGATAGLILGRVGNENGASADTPNGSGAIAFALSVNSLTGEVFQAQYLSLLHPTGGASSPDETIALADGAVQASVSRTDKDGDVATDSNNNIGLEVKFDDDGPTITGQAAGSLTPNDLQVANTLNATDSSSYTLGSGADGLKSFNIVGPADSSGDFTWQYFDVDGVNGVENNEIKGFYKGNALYTLELNNDGTYSFKMIGTLPGSTLNLSTAEIKAGAPDTNSIEVGAQENDQFVRISGDSSVGAGNINESNAFVGVDNGNLDTGETLIFTLHNANGSQVNFTGISIGTKAPASSYHVVAHLVGGGTYVQDLALAKNAAILVDPPGNVLVSSIEITKTAGSSTKIGIGDIDIFTLPADVQLGFTVELKDGDNDTTTASFVVDIDGNLDGNYDSNVNALSVVNPLSSSTLYDPFAHQHQDLLLM
ncbi:DUF5801 domain-containing protein [Sphingomonas sp. SM33]|uniref:DUF5801 domain-containing protein n=1 Tax=Sphingomonas telluris TaxID=2907998 RepID=A0ABS9VNP6_9SPHN|nr:DUF5801 repeats-in-toxin domain-containing protein [Sphingomonas telluris]MCH8616323.1 DUF5801 domain-containing protein [Sphingomonas telluris]